MKKIAMIVVGVIGIALLTIIGLAASKPDELRVERSTSIKAGPDKVFALIEDFREWPKWSPYEKLDPDMQRSYSGAEKGKGAVYEWSGNDDAGQGRIDIEEATAPTKLALKLHFVKPFESTNTVNFLLEPAGDETKVTWLMYGPNPFFSKIMQVFMDMDKMCGDQFNEGLANLKSVTEREASKASAT